MSMTRKARPASPNPSGWPDEKALLALKDKRTELIAVKSRNNVLDTLTEAFSFLPEGGM